MDLSYLSLLLISLLFSAIITLFLKHEEAVKDVTGGSSPLSSNIIKPYPIIGNLPHLVKNRARFFDWMNELLSVNSTVNVAPIIFTADPAVVEHTARSNFASYPKGPAFTNALHDLLGHGIFTTNGESWRLQRKIASSEFNTRAFRALVHDSVRRELETRLIPLLDSAAMTSSVIDLQDLLQRFGLDNICNVVFNADPACLGGREPASHDGERFYRAFEDAAYLSIYRWFYPFHWMWKLLRWLNAGSERQLRASIATVRAYIQTFMHDSQTSSLLSRFAESADLSEESLRDILINILSAGRDTTPSSAIWFFWSLFSAPHVVEKILREISSIRSKSQIEGLLPLDVLREMHYLQAALTESMRLNPPVPMMPRECIVDDVLPDGTKVKKGWTVMYSSYAMGRSERVWGKGAAEFRPKRWLEDGVFRPESSFRYTVFHAGPRVCLGKEMAYIQMKLLAATVIERFEMEVVKGSEERQIGITMKMAGGLCVKVKKRKTWENNFVAPSELKSLLP